MLEKKITKSRLQQLLEEANSIKVMEAKVKETILSKRHVKII